MFDSVVVHYAEIALKGNNRSTFEKLLIDNIRKKVDAESVKRDDGQITINLNEGFDYEKVKTSLKKIPGIAYFSFARSCDSELEVLKKEVVDFIKDEDFSTFKIDAQRRDKRYGVKSTELNALLGSVVIDVYGKKVKMKTPDLVLRVEVTGNGAYLSKESVQGVGGLPTNPKQKVVALLSGGFDSPVAAYMLMRRGCEVILVHFKNENQMASSVEGKIVDLAGQLSCFQIKTVLYIVPFGRIQKEIIMRVKAESRMLVYRRFMLKIASKVAEVNGARFLVVGDSLSQVASQTIENLEATYADAGAHVLSPLIGLNKEEIINISRGIGTYDISAQPYGDCCSYFLPKHPSLKVNVGILRDMESQFDVGSLVGDAVKSAEIRKF
ncbi:MAG: tRNA uracil 4-sulfurtransferase ThiI [archaeon]